MKKPFVALTAILLTGLFAYSSYGEEKSDRPPGVPVEAWIPFTQTSGFIVFGPDYPVSRPSANALPILRGYFVTKHKGAWVRLQAVPGDGSYLLK